MAATEVDGFVVASQSFFVGNRLVPAGEVWVASDLLVKTYRQNFRPLHAQVSDQPAPKPRPALRRSLSRA